MKLIRILTSIMDLEKGVIEFAKEHPEIKAVSLGNDPEEDIPTVYFFTQEYIFDEVFQNALT